MRVTLALLFMSALAMPLAGAAGPLVSPSAITVRAGDSATLHGSQGAGGLSDGFPYRYDFFSDTPGVAIVQGFASGGATTRPDPIPRNGDVYVRAIRPGVAHVRTTNYPLNLATITVLPAIGPVEIHADATHVKPGQKIVFTAVVPGWDQMATFCWYRGRIGDNTNLIQASTNPQLTVVTNEPGTSYLWVQAFAGTTASSAEIAVETDAPRRRAVAH
jgi:hypothetical protein